MGKRLDFGISAGLVTGIAGLIWHVNTRASASPELGLEELPVQISPSPASQPESGIESPASLTAKGSEKVPGESPRLSLPNISQSSLDEVISRNPTFPIRSSFEKLQEAGGPAWEYLSKLEPARIPLENIAATAIMLQDASSLYLFEGRENTLALPIVPLWEARKSLGLDDYDILFSAHDIAEKKGAPIDKEDADFILTHLRRQKQAPPEKTASRWKTESAWEKVRAVKGLLPYATQMFSSGLEDRDIYRLFMLNVPPTESTIQLAKQHLDLGIPSRFVPFLVYAAEPPNQDLQRSVALIEKLGLRGQYWNFGSDIEDLVDECMPKGMPPREANLLSLTAAGCVPNQSQIDLVEFLASEDRFKRMYVEEMFALVLGQVDAGFVKAARSHQERLDGFEILGLWTAGYSKNIFEDPEISPKNSLTDPEKYVRPTKPESPMFHQNIPWTRIEGDGVIRVGVWSQEKGGSESPARWYDLEAAIERLDPRAKKAGIEINLLKTREQLQNALGKVEKGDIHYDITLLDGHANVGRGPNLMVEGALTPDYFWMGESVLRIPERYQKPWDVIIKKESDKMVVVRGSSSDLEKLDIDCELVVYSCCRGNRYYRKKMEEHAPSTVFVSTNYNSLDLRVPLLEALIHTLEERKPLSRFIEIGNIIQGAMVGDGMVSESFVYQMEPTPLPRVMFQDR